MESQKFDNTWRGPSEFEGFLAENDRKLGDLLRSDAMQSVNQDRFNPMSYPRTLIALIGVTLIGIFVSRWRSSQRQPLESTPAAAARSAPVSGTGLLNAAAILAAIVAYAWLAETFGFLILASLILFGLLIRLRTRWLASVLITAVAVPALYGVFSILLRVPLP